MSLQGHMENGMVVLHDGASLPDGTLVEVTPLAQKGDKPSTIIAAREAKLHLGAEDVAELQRAIMAGKRPAPPIDPFRRDSARPA